MTKVKFQWSQKWPYFLLENQNWWLHAKFQHPRLKNDGDIVIRIFFLKFWFPPKKSCIGPYSPGGHLRPKLLPPLGFPRALVSNPIINQISIFWRPIHTSNFSQNCSLKYALNLRHKLVKIVMNPLHVIKCVLKFFSILLEFKDLK